jgi:hypothetical protein
MTTPSSASRPVSGEPFFRPNKILRTGRRDSWLKADLFHALRSVADKEMRTEMKNTSNFKFISVSVYTEITASSSLIQLYCFANLIVHD